VQQGVILLIESDLNLADLTSFILEKRGYELHHARDGVTGLRMFEEINPDMVILDIFLDRLDGISVCREIRQNFSEEILPILILSAAEDVEHIVEGFEAGANDYLVKPYKAAELIAKTRVMIGRRRRISRRRKTKKMIYRIMSGEPVCFDSEVYTLSEYTMEECLGRGSMGAVFRTRMPDGTPVAIKILDPDLHTDKRGVQRFHREANTLKELNHPYIVRIFDVGSTQGFHFYAMEYVAGRSLLDIIDKDFDSITASLVTDILIKISHSLESMWTAGLIHRDIKPNNILLTTEGIPKLVDFGLAKGVNDVGLTRTGIIYGTPNYMSPEQIQGLPLDFRTDVYSLGATAYHMLCGAPPFDCMTTRRILYRHIFEEVAPPCERNHSISQDLNTVLMRMLAKEPTDRFDSYDELRRALTPIATQSAAMS
jgi:serine/threonine protein kinase